MLRTAAACAALGLTAGLCLSTASAQPPLEETQFFAAAKTASVKTDDVVRVTSEQPKDENMVNPRNGKVITLEMVQNDAEWQRETAEMLRRDTTAN